MKDNKNLFMQDWFFIPLFTMLSAGVFGTAYMYIQYGVGSMQGVTVNIMMSTGDWITMASMGIGLFIARVLEGSMVGLIDIGGGCMYGIGGFCVAFLAIMGFDWLYNSFVLTLLAGAIVGLLVSALVMIVRKMMPEGVAAAGSDIMMQVGTDSAQFMAPIFIIMALANSIPLGVFACIGGCIAHLRGSNMIGGIVLGMFVAAFIFA